MASGTPQWSRIFSTLRSKRDTFLLIAKGWRAISRKRHRRVRARPVDPAIRCEQEQSRHRAPILTGTGSYVRRTLPDRNLRVLSSLREIRPPALLDNELPAPIRTGLTMTRSLLSRLIYIRMVVSTDLPDIQRSLDSDLLLVV